MAPTDPARRNFLRGDIRGRNSARFVPWAAVDFVDLCRRCDDCIVACEEQILVRADGGFPSIDFRRGGCTFCGACASACEHAAIRQTSQPAWNLKAIIGTSCLEARGVTCRACGEACGERAIRFSLRVGGGADLHLDRDACTGCGGCLAVCPVHAVTIAAASTDPVSASNAAETSQPMERA